MREYALYFEYLAHDLADYMVKDTTTYIGIFGKEGVMDPINPWLYNWDYIDTWEFKEFFVDNYAVYSDDCFTVDVNFDLYITFDENKGDYGRMEGLEHDEKELDATFVWVKEKGGDGSWLISDIVIHY